MEIAIQLILIHHRRHTRENPETLVRTVILNLDIRIEEVNRLILIAEPTIIIVAIIGNLYKLTHTYIRTIYTFPSILISDCAINRYRNGDDREFSRNDRDKDQQPQQQQQAPPPPRPVNNRWQEPQNPQQPQQQYNDGRQQNQNNMGGKSLHFSFFFLIKILQLQQVAGVTNNVGMLTIPCLLLVMSVWSKSSLVTRTPVLTSINTKIFPWKVSLNLNLK